MITNKILENGNISCTMTSEDGLNTVQAKVEYVLKKVKKGTFATVTFDPSVDINTEYDCAFSMLENTIPENIYCCVLGNKPKDKGYDIIEDAVKRCGFEVVKGKYMKNI